jgi:uncharacterized protein
VNTEINLKMKRLNRILRIILDEVLNSSVEEREQPVEWSIKHVFSCSQLAKLLAYKRGLDIELSGIAGAIHDIAIIKTGVFRDHGPLGAPMVQKLLLEYNKKFGKELGIVSDHEIELIVQATYQHTEKKKYTDNKFIELIKDVDSLDRFLHGLETYDFYSVRCKNALKELEIEFKDFC